MSFLKGKLGRSAAVVGFSLGAFQALSIVGALPASAAPTCTYASGALTITDDVSPSTVNIQQDNNGQVGVWGTGAVACTGGPILIANLTSITISGGIGDQQVTIWMSTTGSCGFTALPGANTGNACVPVGAVKLASWAKVNWSISLGAETATALPAGDKLYIYDAATTHAAALDLAMGANGIDLNNDADLDVTVSGIEHYKVQSDSAGNDVINAGGTTATGAAFTQALDGLVAADFGIAADFPVGHPTCRREFSATALTPLPAGCHDKTLTGGAGNDRISATGDGYNTVAPGAGDDYAQGDGDDNLDYSGSPAAINANLPGDTVNGWGLDTFLTDTFTDVIGSALGDTLLGRDSEYNYFIPGAGNDTVTGGSTSATDGSESDAYDVSDAEDGVTVDLSLGTSTGGSGTDTLVGIEDVYGTEANDTITGTSSTSVGNYLAGAGGNDTLAGGPGDGDGPDWMDGGAGIDTVDYGVNTKATTVNLQQPPCGFAFQDFFPEHGLGNGTNCQAEVLTYVAPGPPVVTVTAATPANLLNKSGVASEGDVLINVENAILGTGNDTFNGSTFNNIVWPNGGQNVLNGCPAAVVVGCGIDTVNYSVGYDAGVVVNLSGGGQAGGSQDSITGFSNAVGTAFNDTLIGTDLVNGTNGANLLVGAKGNDEISGNAGPDLVRGGAGNDRIRGGQGDDTLKAQGGKDNVRGGTGDDDIFGGKGKDFCVGGGGHDLIKTCERPRHHHQGPNGPGVAHLARLMATKP
jgi:Ca2+-binding RTX toxin-like protein